MSTDYVKITADTNLIAQMLTDISTISGELQTVAYGYRGYTYIDDASGLMLPKARDYFIDYHDLTFGVLGLISSVTSLISTALNEEDIIITAGEESESYSEKEKPIDEHNNLPAAELSTKLREAREQ